MDVLINGYMILNGRIAGQWMDKWITDNRWTNEWTNDG